VMTQIEKLAARLKQLQGRAVTILVIVGPDGQPAAWSVQAETKLEGGIITANGDNPKEQNT